MTVLCIDFLVILSSSDSNEIGLWFEHSSLKPFLKIGAIFAVLNLSGKIPEEKERLKILERWLEIGCFANFKIVKRILLMPIALLLFKISSSVIKFRNF